MEKNNNEKFSIITLWATATEDDMYINISNNKSDVENWFEYDKKNEGAVKIVEGYGVLDNETGFIADGTKDFYYIYGEALYDLTTK